MTIETAVIVVLVAGVIGLLRAQLRLRRSFFELRDRFALATPYAIGSGVPSQEIGPIVGFAEWTVVAKGGNLNPGKIGGLGLCPCQHEYTVATVQTPLAAWPNPAAVAACAANPPAPRAAEWNCPEDCVQVLTHVWRGWIVVRNVRTGQLLLNCHTFAQYHCKRPGDPDIDRPPQEGDPGTPPIEA